MVLRREVTSLKITDGSGAPGDWIGRAHSRRGRSIWRATVIIKEEARVACREEVEVAGSRYKLSFNLKDCQS